MHYDSQILVLQFSDIKVFYLRNQGVAMNADDMDGCRGDSEAELSMTSADNRQKIVREQRRSHRQGSVQK